MGKKFANLPQITWGETKTRFHRAIHRRNRQSGGRSEIYRQQRQQKNFAALQTPPEGRGRATRAEKMRLLQGGRGSGKFWVAALASLFSDLVLDVRIENEREVGGIYIGA